MKRTISVDWKRLAAFGVIATAVLALQAGPAYAFDDIQSAVVPNICKAFNVAKTILITAAVLALIIGMAPMLWGQVKVKWIISALVGSTLFSLSTTIIAAFANGASGC